MKYIYIFICIYIYGSLTSIKSIDRIVWTERGIMGKGKEKKSYQKRGEEKEGETRNNFNGKEIRETLPLRSAGVSGEVGRSLNYEGKPERR